MNAQPESGGSRLDRLIKLLDTGSSVDARREAARQIGELAASHAGQLPNLLRRIRAHLRSKKWDTRVAASQTMSEIAMRLRHPSIATMEMESDRAARAEANAKRSEPTRAKTVDGFSASDALDLTFDKFDVERVLAKAGVLLSSSGLGWHLEHGGGTKAERLAQAKASLKRRLGMELGPEAGAMMDENMKMSDLVRDEDLLDDDGERLEVKEKVAVGDSAAEAVDGLTGHVDYSHLSARELNKLKRKAKRALREGLAPADFKRTKKDEDEARAERERAEAEEDDEEQAEVAAGGWPLARTCEALAYMLFSEGWEDRHGAAAALREVLRHQAASAAVWAPPPGVKLEPDTIEQARDANARWLEDMCVRLLCILALDRFGDFAGDGAVAPVRETSAQALGASLLPLSPRAVDAVVSCTLTLLSRPEWEVRHSALLGLKYILAAKSELALDLLPAALPAATKALIDADDDVRGAAAESLLPAAEHLPSHPQFDELLTSLWGLLTELDDLSPSAVPVMKLIAKVYALESTRSKSSVQLASVVPRLWPFAAHPIASVRLAVWQTISRLLAVEPNSSTELWVQEACAPAMRHAMQGALFDEDTASAEAASQAWTALLRTVPIAIVEASFMVHGGKWCELATTVVAARPEGHLIFVSQPPSVKGEVRAVAKDWPATTVGRLRGLECLARLAAAFGSSKRTSSVERMEAHTVTMLTGVNATARLAGAHFLTLWLQIVPPGPERPSLQEPGAQLASILANTNPAYPSAPSPTCYGEVAQMVKFVKSESMSFLRVAATNGVEVSGEVPSPEADGFGADSAVTLSSAVPQTKIQAVEIARSSLLASAQRLRDTEAKLHGAVLAAAAGAAVSFGALPPKLNPFIQPLMSAVRREQDWELQRRAANSVASMIKLCADRKPSPNDKLLKNISIMACGDIKETPRARIAIPEDEFAAPKKKVANGGVVDEEDFNEETVARIGAEACIRAVCAAFGADIFTKCPTLEKLIIEPIEHAPAESADAPSLQALIDALQMLKVLGPVAHEAIVSKVIDATRSAFAAAMYSDAAVRVTASKSIATIARAYPHQVISPLLAYIVPRLEDGEAAAETAKRAGSVGLASELTTHLGSALAPYCVLLLVPLMGRMSDPDLSIRGAATKAFAALVPLLPLARGKSPPDELTAQQKERSNVDGEFLEALLDNSKIEDFQLPFKCTRTLRPYQQDGVNWLAFLRRFKLHGALADDMGLGKTLQSTCILAATTVERKRDGKKSLPHLVICPTTLVGHWAYEISQYVEPDVLKPLEYQGTPGERLALQKLFSKHDVVIMSYESVRADEDTLGGFDWCYCVLDEGHAIRNPKSRITQAVKAVRAEHRLLLSGTPIQNDVVELWSLFDFLMPGFLGTEKEFKATYGIAAARSAAAKKGGGLTEQGALATGALHKQVMPFVMRRTKDQVLKDLPPKIIQDVFVDLTEAQRKMYDSFESSEAKNQAVEAIQSGGSGDGDAQHVFQTLQYLRKLCSHPRLVAGDGTKKAAKLDPEMRSPKFDALKQILLDCGIGVDVEEEKSNGGEAKPNPASGSGHRVLVFTQLKGLLDLVENELFSNSMRDVSWLRLDGSVAPSQRFEVVRKFNADPSIDVLLLTTHVGGLGLNLTAADTVVFLEHDWNPQKDLQAMDRAHRLGQRRTVNVYRILTRGTLEEKIMSLQRFKLDVANAVVNADNASMSAMDTGQMLELFTAEKGVKLGKDGAPVEQKGAAAAAASAASGGLANVLHGVEELWDQAQYDEEFSVDEFVANLKK